MTGISYLIVCLTAAAASAADAEVLAHWPMDAAEGGVTRDVSGHGLDAVVKGETLGESIRTGAFGGAAFFDNGRNWLEAPSSPLLSLRDDFTIACAILPFSVDGFRTILWKGDRQVVPEAINYYFDLRDGKVELKAKDAEGLWVVHSTSPVVAADAWHFIVASYSGGAVRIWVNGEEHPVRTGENGRIEEGLLPNEAPLVIGAGGNSSGIAYSFHGLIDEVRILRGASAGPCDIEMAAWHEAVDRYGRRVAIARLDAVRERVRAEQREGLPRWEAALLDRLDNACEKAAQEDAQEIEQITRTIHEELDRLAYRTFYRDTVGAGEAFGVFPVRASERAVKQPRFFEDIPRVEQEVVLETARNEYEGFQLVVTPGFEEGIGELSVNVTDLTCQEGHVLSSAHTEWGWIRPIETETPDIAVPFVGRIPDAIIEGRAPPPIAPYDFECVYVRVFVPPDAVPGDYAGVVRVSAGGATRAIPVQVRVHRFILPETTPLKMAFSFFEQYYAEWYGLERVPRERQRELYEFLLRYRIPPNNIYSKQATYPDLEYLTNERERMTFFTYSTGIPHPGTATPETVAESIDRIEEIHERLREEDLLDNAYFYCFDELALHPDRFNAARRFVAPLRERIPEIRVMQTSFPVAPIRDLFNVWCPITHDFDQPEKRAVLEALRAQGNRIWWYMADAPRHPFPNLFLDYPPFDARILGVLSFMYDVEGVLYWCINREWKTNVDEKPRWPEGDWKAHIYHIHRGTRKFKNGMGNLIYPASDGRLYPSLRLENLRDGIEDHVYLALLRELAESPEEAGVAPELRRRARELLEIPSAVARAAGDYNPDPAALLGYRSSIAALLSQAAPLLDPAN